MRHIEIDGAAPTVEQLYRAATINYGHFTSMQVRDRAVRGLALHLQRLKGATRELFGTDLNETDVIALIRHALADRADASVRVTVFPGTGDLGAPENPTSPNIMITVSDPVSEKSQHPWSVRTTYYVRDMAHLKHVATMGLIHHWRVAVSEGFDDALFVDGGRLLSEGSAWNLALWDGCGFIWPQADALAGITMQLLQAALPRTGVTSLQRPVHRDELPGFRGALATYSHCPAQPVARVDDAAFPGNVEAQAALRAAWETVPWDQL